MLLKYVVNDYKYKDINQILKQEFNISSRLLRKLINSNHIMLNQCCVDTRTLVSIGDIVIVNLDFDEDSENIISTNIKLDILFEDEGLLILNKPAGIAVHPSILHYEDSLSNGVKFYFEQIGLHRKIRPVNRLDFNTSGIIIFAKNEYIQECLIKQMKENIFHKEYVAIVSGQLEHKVGTINLPIARKENSIIERCISDDGQQSITEYQVLKEYNDFSLVNCILKTGRTHQIRVHMSAIDHPLLGDTLYGCASNLIDRQALHSYRISFIHPINHRTINLSCDLPYDMKNVLNSYKDVSSYT